MQILMKRIVGLGWIAYAALAVSACGYSSQANQQIQQSPASNVKSYAKDGLLGTTHSNPNVPTNPTYHTHSDDFNMINQSVRKVAGVNDVAIVLNGPRAVVTIKVDPALSRAEQLRIRDQVQQTVTENVPRYRIAVKLAKNS